MAFGKVIELYMWRGVRLFFWKILICRRKFRQPFMIRLILRPVNCSKNLVNYLLQVKLVAAQSALYRGIKASSLTL